MASYSVFVGHVGIGNVIDTDHWRHFYLITGIIWGCIALERRWQLARRRPSLRQALHRPAEQPVAA